MIYVRSDIPQYRRVDIEECIQTCESGRVEMLALELILHDEKWLLISVYKQPKVKNGHIVEFLDSLLNKCSSEVQNCIICGDLNINVLPSGHCFEETFEVQGVKNIVNSHTCFKNSEQPTVIDLVITNVPKRIKSVVSIDTGLSDFHNMVCFATKLHTRIKQKQRLTYRSYKNFNEKKYHEDLSYTPFHVSDIFDTVEDQYWFCQQMFKNVIDDHAPIKHRIVKHNQAPYMNSELRKAINVRNMLRRRYDKCKNKHNWENYKLQRNNVCKLRKSSKNQYLREKCNQNVNIKDFWQTITPMISNKSKGSMTDISLLETDTIINEPTQVADVFNNYHGNVTKDIGFKDDIDENDSL